ncbi:glycosyltransferase [Deinococcus peraridilitoris DSM 19664]|uniref:Glycosyltransferase n=2 Tax=Deinococcus TaxID=1298 RepID=K9ZZ67_DEIPD|nr:glycosyltransferase [Deinococcus peraridilitoris DSM 19664]
MRYLPRPELTALLDKYDVVQCVTGSPAFGYAARDTKAPVLLQTATLIRNERRMLLQGRGLIPLLRRVMTEITARIDMLALARADVVQVENRWMDRELRRRFPTKVRFDPPGVDADFFHPMSLSERVLKDPYILSVGRFNDPRKNVSLLFRAYRQLRDQLHQAPRLVLAGKTMPRPVDLALLDELQLRPYVDLRPDVGMDELRMLYAQAQAFALSSDEEGLGLVLLEAMASGCPVVSTASGGPETMIAHGGTGLLVALNDPEALAGALQQLLQNPSLRNELSCRARKLVEERFSIQSAREHFLNEYRSSIARSGKGTA